MACFLPQFKCPSDSHLVAKPCQHLLQIKSKEYACFRAQCMLSSTTLVDTEMLQIPSFKPISASLTSVKPLTYVGAIGPPLKENFDRRFAAESLLANEESVIAAAAVEAVALARAAVEMARDAAQMVGSNSLKQGKCEEALSEVNILQLDMARLFAMESDEKTVHSATTEVQSEAITVNGSSITVEYDIPVNERDPLEFQDSEGIAVKSNRQTERRARRARAAEKMAAGIASTKSVFSIKRKRAALQEVIYSDPLRYLRGTTTTSRLLTATEETELSEGIQDLLKLERVQEELMKRYGSQPTFSQWAAAAGIDQKTLRKRLNCGILCKDKMIKSNIRLVISIAKNYQGAGMNLQDLVQEGCKGLVRGTEKFDASKGFKFSTYAHWWIKQAVRKSLSKQSRTIRLPFHMVEATYRVRESRKQFYSENGRYPDNKEVVEATGLSMKRLQAVLLIPKAPRSLDQKIGINQNMKLSDVIADPVVETAESLLIKQFMKQDLNKVLDRLNPKEKQVVRWMFGLEDGRMKTLQEIGELMGVSRERIRQIESCAFRKLKNKRKSKSLQQYLIS